MASGHPNGQDSRPGTRSGFMLEEEIKEGWIAEVPGGVAARKTQYSSCAAGKLGLVQAPGPGRSPRFVVDSFGSAATENICLPHRSCNLTLSHLRRCLPVGGSLEEMSALVLDVAKARGRIINRPEEQGHSVFLS